MIIQCPACSTRYVVPDTAIGVEGRTVRCAKCRESWFQEGPVPEAAGEPAAGPVSAPPPASAAGVAPQAMASGNAGLAEPVAASAPAPTRSRMRNSEDVEFAPVTPPQPPLPTGEARYDADAASQFDARPPFRQRRNPLKLWTWAAGIFAVVAAGLIFAVSYYGLPDWVPVSRPTFAAAQPDLQLSFPAEQQERRQLPNGTEFFGASGTVTNIGTVERALPTLLIVLRDGRDRIVYSWEVPPPQRMVAPGESVTINEAVTDIPRSARFAEIGWKPE